MCELMFDMEIAQIIQPDTMVLLKPFVAVNIERSSPTSKPVLDGLRGRLNRDSAPRRGSYPAIHFQGPATEQVG
jgi:hypothetical protein